MTIELVYCKRDENGQKTAQRETTGRTGNAEWLAGRFERAALRGKRGKARRRQAEELFENTTHEG